MSAQSSAVTALLVRCSAAGMQVGLKSGGGGLRLEAPDTPPAELVRAVRARLPEVLAYLRQANSAAGQEDASRFSLQRPGCAEWTGSPALYGLDALPRRHVPPATEPPEDRPDASPFRLCGGCARWQAEHSGAEMGECAAGWNAHGLPQVLDMRLPSTSRGSRCWASQGRGWQPRPIKGGREDQMEN